VRAPSVAGSGSGSAAPRVDRQLSRAVARPPGDNRGSEGRAAAWGGGHHGGAARPAPIGKGKATAPGRSRHRSHHMEALLPVPTDDGRSMAGRSLVFDGSTNISSGMSRSRAENN
jgi:hypothetical protein